MPERVVNARPARAVRSSVEPGIEKLRPIRRYLHTPNESGSIVTLPEGAVVEVVENPENDNQITAENAATLFARGILTPEEVVDG